MTSTGAGPESHPSLPPYWPFNARLWFRCVDFTLTRSGITDQRGKYDIVRQHLQSDSPHHWTESLESIADNDNAYNQLKRRLLVAHPRQSKHKKQEKNKANPDATQLANDLSRVVLD